MSVANVQQATETYDCKAYGCTNRARANRGHYAYLCDDHIERARQGKSPGTRPAPVGADDDRSVHQLASEQTSFEAKAKGLVAVGKRLDKARARYRPAKSELDRAMAEWRSACRALAGEGADR